VAYFRRLDYAFATRFIHIGRSCNINLGAFADSQG
jgi:hypothetical protein